MNLIEPQFHVTFFPGNYPANAGGVVLLGPDHWVDDAAACNAAFDQIIQEANYIREDAPDFFPRGNRKTDLEFVRVIPEIPIDGTAIALAMDAGASIPKVKGWILLELPHLNRQWAITPAAVERLETIHNPTQNMLSLRWRIKKGVATEIATSAADSAITTELGVEILTEDDSYYLALES